MRILVVDDMFKRRKWLKQLLEKQGYKVAVSTDGQAALIKLTSLNRGLRKFQLVLTDTKMPCMSGPELVEEMNSRRINIPIIGMSNREESRGLFENFWNKNEPPEKLFALIKKLTPQSP